MHGVISDDQAAAMSRSTPDVKKPAAASPNSLMLKSRRIVYSDDDDDYLTDSEDDDYDSSLSDDDEVVHPVVRQYTRTLQNDDSVAKLFTKAPCSTRSNKSSLLSDMIRKSNDSVDGSSRNASAASSQHRLDSDILTAMSSRRTSRTPPMTIGGQFQMTACRAAEPCISPVTVSCMSSTRTSR